MRRDGGCGQSRERTALCRCAAGGVATAIVLATFACVREPLPEICPDIAAGQLVITELHGKTGSDPQWIEITNRSGQAIDLLGLRLHFSGLSSGGERKAIIRYSRSIAAGDYFVFGIVPDMDLPEIIDYGLQGSHVVDPVAMADSETGMKEEDDDPVVVMPPEGIITLEACDARIDRVVYPPLPAEGTRSFGGTPEAEANDDELAWCTDDFVPPDQPTTEIGARGTPGEPNRPCE